MLPRLRKGTSSSRHLLLSGDLRVNVLLRAVRTKTKVTCASVAPLLPKPQFFSPPGLKVLSLRGTSLVWVAKRTKQFVPRRPGGVGGDNGVLATTFSSVRPLPLAAVHGLLAVAFSHVSCVRHVSLQLFSVMSDMSVMSACASCFPVFSFHLSKYFTFQFSATKCRVNLHDKFCHVFAEGFHVKSFSLLTLLLKGDFSERHEKSLFSFLINNLVAVEASCLLRVYVTPIHCGSMGRGLLVLFSVPPNPPFDAFRSVQNSPLFSRGGTSSSRHLLLSGDLRVNVLLRAVRTKTKVTCASVAPLLPKPQFFSPPGLKVLSLRGTTLLGHLVERIRYADDEVVLDLQPVAVGEDENSSLPSSSEEHSSIGQWTTDSGMPRGHSSGSDGTGHSARSLVAVSLAASVHSARGYQEFEKGGDGSWELGVLLALVAAVCGLTGGPVRLRMVEVSE